MVYNPDDVSIHAKKYHRVILEGINTDLESPESFAVKLSARMRVSLRRVKVLTGQLPCTVKSHLTAAQANRLKDVLEEFGGRVRVEAHLVTPTGTGVEADPRAAASGSRADAQIASCPDCGWEVEKGATYCSFCHRRFRDPAMRRQTLEDRIPEKNPLDADWDPSATHTRTSWRAVHGYVLIFLFGVVAVLAVFVLTK
jgi:hypothetical protein